MNSKSKGMKTRSALWISSERDQASNIEFVLTCMSPLHSHVWAVQSQGLYNLPYDLAGCIHIYTHTYRYVCPRGYTHSVDTCYVHMQCMSICIHMHDMYVYICTSYILYRDELLIAHPSSPRFTCMLYDSTSPLTYAWCACRGFLSRLCLALSRSCVALSRLCVPLSQ